MNLPLQAKLIFLAIGLGIAAILLTPADWFLYLFLPGGLLALLSGMAAAADAEDVHPLSSKKQVVAFFFVGLENPRAVIPATKTLLVFKSTAAFTAAMAATMLVRLAA